MKTFKLFLFIISINSILIAGEINWDISHDTSQLSYVKYNGYDLIILNNGRIHIPEGCPALPAIVLRLSIPRTSRVMSVTFEDDIWIDVGNYDIMPAQPATPINMDPIFVSENQEIYSKNEYYPENSILSFNTGNKSGFMIAGINYCPLRYNPVTHELQLLQSGRIVIKYQEGLEDIVYLSKGQINIYSSDVMGMVSNPQDLIINAPLVKEGKDPLTEYVIVTPSDLVTSFESLIQWKRQKGISSMVVSDAWVYANYSGYDNMEKIREFVKDYHQNHGLVYFVMAGDYDNLGARIVPISCIYFVDDVPCDRYFSDVVPYSSDWDANNNHIY